MPFIPHTEKEIKTMLDAIGIKAINTLFDEIPVNLKHVSLDGIPKAISEMELTRAMQSRAQADLMPYCFIGAGAYDHFIPATVFDIASRGEFYSAYTPYQAEASQGLLQLIFEYQSMMANLMSMEVSNASLYDGASAFAESLLMAVRLSKGSKNKILVPSSLNPFYRKTAQTIISQQNIKMIDIPYDKKTGRTVLSALDQLISDEVAALVIPQPNFFGVIEEVDVLTNYAEKHQLISIAVVNPIAMALLKPPGEWGEKGIDILCGEGQPLGIPLSSGGPYYGFLCCKKAHVRQMPGRLVGKTIDTIGNPGYVLTLQAREQHIRRSKATSNICTNQGLMVTASTIFMSLVGPVGLRKMALRSHEQTKVLKSELSQIPGINFIFDSPFFHEVVLTFNQPVKPIINALAKKGIQAGFQLELEYPELKNCLLVCATETKTVADIHHYQQALLAILNEEHGSTACHRL